MSAMAKQITDMVDMLPEQEQSLAFEVIKRLVLAWDPSFSKVTPAEAAELEAADAEFACGEYVRHEDINWN
jgi:hypothetical protein